MYLFQNVFRMSCTITKFEMAIAIGINPFKSVAGIVLGFLEVVKNKNKSIIITPNPRLVSSEIIAALISVFCRANSIKSKVEEVGGLMVPEL